VALALCAYEGGETRVAVAGVTAHPSFFLLAAGVTLTG